MRLLAERHRVATIPRSDAPRRNAVLDAPRRPSGQTQCRGRRASRNAFPRGAGERVQTLLLQCVMSGGRWCSPRSVVFLLYKWGQRPAGTVREVGWAFLPDRREPQPRGAGQECPAYPAYAPPYISRGARKRWWWARSVENDRRNRDESGTWTSPTFRHPSLALPAHRVGQARSWPTGSGRRRPTIASTGTIMSSYGGSNELRVADGWRTDQIS